MHILANIFWVLVSAVFALIFILQFNLCQDRANHGNLAGLLWEGTLLIVAISLIHWAWPF